MSIIAHLVDSAGRIATLDNFGVIRRRLSAEPAMTGTGPRERYAWHVVDTSRLPATVTGIAADYQDRIVVRCSDGSFHREVARPLGQYDHGQSWQQLDTVED